MPDAPSAFVAEEERVAVPRVFVRVPIGGFDGSAG